MSTSTGIPNWRAFGEIGLMFANAVATRFANSRIEVVIAEEHDREHSELQSMLDRIWDIKQQYGISAIYCDGANPVVWQPLKKMFNELSSNNHVTERLAFCKKNGLDPASYMRVIPTLFGGGEGKKMLQHTKSLVEDPKGLIAIDKRFEKLLTALRTAVAEEYKLQKDQTSYDDVLDAFMLSLQYYKRSR
jgi:hypothetical protein